ncbi:MAG: DUF1351 domain-containing protein [Clostridia bacterium]
MEENKLELVKPEFSGEIQVKIKSLGEIESNMKEVKGYVENLNNYYKNITFTEETIKEAKEEKAKINKFKSEVANYRKNIVAEYNKPIKIFEDTSKETEKILTETYNTINSQVANYEDIEKQRKEQEIKDYFEEYKVANNIDFINYGQAKINVTLTASVKKLKGQAKAFIDEIIDDLKLIETQECKDEILVEYKQNLNVSRAIQEVANRHRLLEEERKRQEEKIVHIEMNENHEISQKSYEELEDVFNKPLEQPKEEKQEELFTMSFKVKNETKARLKLIKQFLENGGYDYE